jgi:hypothetical protein
MTHTTSLLPMNGPAPDIFTGDNPGNADTFLVFFQMFVDKNPGHPLVATPYQRAMLALSFIRRPAVGQWVKVTKLHLLSALLPPFELPPTDETFWEVFQAAFRIQFRHIPVISSLIHCALKKATHPTSHIKGTPTAKADPPPAGGTKLIFSDLGHSRTPPPSQKRCLSAPNPSTPSDLLIEEAQYALAYKKRLLTWSSRTPAGPLPDPPPVSPGPSYSEKWCLEWENCCFSCHDVGHHTKECPKTIATLLLRLNRPFVPKAIL